MRLLEEDFASTPNLRYDHDNALAEGALMDVMRLWTFSLLLIIGALYVCGPINAANVPRNAGIVPEFYLKDGHQKFCVVQITLRDGSAQARRRSVTNLIDAAYKYTAGWRKHFVLVGIDFVEFSSFQVIYFRACSDGPRVESEFDHLWNDQARSCGSICVSIRLTAAQVAQTPFVSEWNKRSNSYSSSVAIFEHYRGRGQLKNCVVFVHANPLDAEYVLQSKLYGELTDIRWKYRMPIVDMYVSGNGIFFLFSRECRARGVLFGRFRQFLFDEYPASVKELSKAELNPDIAEYYYAQTGHKWR